MQSGSKKGSLKEQLAAEKGPRSRRSSWLCSFTLPSRLPMQKNFKHCTWPSTTHCLNQRWTKRGQARPNCGRRAFRILGDYKTHKSYGAHIVPLQEDTPLLRHIDVHFKYEQVHAEVTRQTVPQTSEVAKDISTDSPQGLLGAYPTGVPPPAVVGGLRARLLLLHACPSPQTAWMQSAQHMTFYVYNWGGHSQATTEGEGGERKRGGWRGKREG